MGSAHDTTSSAQGMASNAAGSVQGAASSAAGTVQDAASSAVGAVQQAPDTDRPPDPGQPPGRRADRLRRRLARLEPAAGVGEGEAAGPAGRERRPRAQGRAARARQAGGAGDRRPAQAGRAGGRRVGQGDRSGRRRHRQGRGPVRRPGRAGPGPAVQGEGAEPGLRILIPRGRSDPPRTDCAPPGSSRRGAVLSGATPRGDGRRRACRPRLGRPLSPVTTPSAPLGGPLTAGSTVDDVRCCRRVLVADDEDDIRALVVPRGAQGRLHRRRVGRRRRRRAGLPRAPSCPISPSSTSRCPVRPGSRCAPRCAPTRPRPASASCCCRPAPPWRTSPRGLAAGADAYLAKPFQVSGWCTRCRALTDAAAGMTTVEAGTAALGGADPAVGIACPPPVLDRALPATVLFAIAAVLLAPGALPVVDGELVLAGLGVGVPRRAGSPGWPTAPPPTGDVAVVVPPAAARRGRPARGRHRLGRRCSSCRSRRSWRWSPATAGAASSSPRLGDRRRPAAPRAARQQHRTRPVRSRRAAARPARGRPGRPRPHRQRPPARPARPARIERLEDERDAAAGPGADPRRRARPGHPHARRPRADDDQRHRRGHRAVDHRHRRRRHHPRLEPRRGEDARACRASTSSASGRSWSSTCPRSSSAEDGGLRRRPGRARARRPGTRQRRPRLDLRGRRRPAAHRRRSRSPRAPTTRARTPAGTSSAPT